MLSYTLVEPLCVLAYRLLHFAQHGTMLRARTPLLVVAFAPALLVISIGLIYLRTTCRMQLPTAQVLNSGLEGLPGLLHMWAQHAASHDEASALAQLAADLDEAIARFKSGEAIHPLPAKVQPALTTSSSAPACASAGSASTLESQVQSLAISGLQCHIAWNIDYWGDPLVWGDTHLTDTAADCCAACHAHQLAAARGGLDKGANSTACNTWSHCSDKEKCGDRYRQCWLKHLPSLPPPDGQGTPSVFSSGIVYDSDAWLASYDRKTRLTLRFQMGEVEVELLPELAPASVRELRRLVALLEGGSGNGGGGGGGGCNGCELYRIETAFLVQGVIRHPGKA